MTIGIGGWGSRRKPMSLVRAILRSPLTTSRSSATAGPTSACCARAGKVRKVVYAFVLARLDPARAALPQRPPAGAVATHRARRGHVPARACRPRRGGCRSCRPGSGSAPTSLRPQPDDRARSRSPYDDGEELVADAGAHARRRARPHEPRRRSGGNGQYLGLDPYFDDLMLHGRRRSAFMSRRADRRRPSDFAERRARSRRCASTG